MRSSEEGPKDQESPGKCQHGEIRKGTRSRRGTVKVDSQVGRGWWGDVSGREEGSEGGGIGPSMLLGRREKAMGLAARSSLVTVTWWTGRGARLTGVCSRESGGLFIFFLILALLHKRYPKSLKSFQDIVFDDLITFHDFVFTGGLFLFFLTLFFLTTVLIVILQWTDLNRNFPGLVMMKYKQHECSQGLILNMADCFIDSLYRGHCLGSVGAGLVQLCQY